MSGFWIDEMTRPLVLITSDIKWVLVGLHRWLVAPAEMSCGGLDAWAERRLLYCTDEDIADIDRREHDPDVGHDGKPTLPNASHLKAIRNLRALPEWRAALLTPVLLRAWERPRFAAEGFQPAEGYPGVYWKSEGKGHEVFVCRHAPELKLKWIWATGANLDEAVRCLRSFREVPG